MNKSEAIKKLVALRPMQLSDAGDALKLSLAEGWNQTEKDWKFFIENPRNVCLLAEYKNKVIGTTVAINYSSQAAWIGMVLVDKEYRGLGISKSLLATCLEQLKSPVKLDATPTGQQVYKKFDFKDEFSITRMVNTSVKKIPGTDDTILPVQQKDIRDIIALDEIAFGVNRALLIEYLVREFPGKAWSLKQDNHINGFALGREGNKYHHIGPVVASTCADAKILITKALEELDGRAAVVDVLSEKEDLINWLSSIGFTNQRQFVRMYRKENPFPGAMDKLYLIAGPELG